MLPTQVLLSLMLSSPPTADSVEMVCARDLGRMTYEDAKLLEGKSVRVSLVCTNRLWSSIGCFVGAEGDKKVGRSVHLVHGFPERGKRIIVEGIMRTQIFPAEIIGGNPYPQRFAIEVTYARQVIP
jgi:hypothetical protein